MNNIKKELHQLCINYVQNRIDTTLEAINGAQQAVNEETKSSAGDKYETSRAMLQQEIEQNRTQLTEANKLMTALNLIDSNNNCDTALPGSLVITNNGMFYIAISAGKLHLEKDVYFAISPASPIGLNLKGKNVGDEFVVNGREYLIENIF